uniref:Secreted protein n=1 Tax=Streptomyces sp. NBC_00003 TaxID=2903608 RepID=A0AAU2V093_9ACTN
MNELHKAAVLVAALGSFAMLAAGTAQAHDGEKGGDRFGIGQSSNCRSHDLNVDVLGQVGILNGVLGNALNGEGNPGAQNTHLGSSMGCNNSALD